MGNVKRSVLAAVTTALVGLVLVGCGGTAAPEAKPSPTGPQTNGLDKLPVEKILEKVKAASSDVELLHAEGDAIGDDGERMSIDVQIKKDKGSLGSLTMGKDLHIDFILIDGKFYMKGDKKFWSNLAGPEVAAVVAGKWVKTKASDVAEVEELTEAEKLISSNLEYTGGMPKKGKPQAVDGHLTLPLTDRDGATAYVALTGEPRLVKIVDKDKNVVTFTYDKEFELTAPPKDEILDPDKM